MPEGQIQSLQEYPLGDFLNLHNQVYADYPAGPFAFTEEDFQNWVRVNGIDLSHCFLMSQAGQALGFALWAVRGKWVRLASMGFLPQARGKGLGRKLLDHCARCFRSEGFQSMQLEVLTSNEAALRLYSQFGFRGSDELVGFEGEFESNRTESFHEVVIEGAIEEAIEEAAHTLDRWADLPWQAAGWSVARQSGSRSFRDESGVWIVGTGPKGRQLRSFALCPQRRSPSLSSLANLIKQFGGFWQVPILFPAQFVPSFEAMGFRLRPFRQQWMRMSL